MRLTNVMTLILLFAACSNNIEYTQITTGKTLGLQYGDSSYYTELVLIKNIPQNNLKQSKIMINYFDSMGLSVHNFEVMPEVKHYFMYFYKSTIATRKYFIAMEDAPKTKGDAYNENKTSLGYIYMGRCKESHKLKITIGRNLGTADDFDIRGLNTDRTFLKDECDTNWYNVNKNNELVKYYMELKNKKL